MSSNSRMPSPWLRRLLLVALTGAACNTGPQLDEVELAATSSYKTQIKNGQLLLTGNGDSTRLALRLRSSASTILDVDVGDDGTAEFSFDRSRFDRIVINAGGGDDVVRMDESNGAFTLEEQVTIMGGPGNDTLLGGVGVETFFGGDGNDTIVPGRGNDAVFMGRGDDTIIWNPGDGSDVVEGEDGQDVMAFNGANVSENIDISADGGRVRFTRDIAGITMDLDGIERILFTARGGADTVVVNDLAGTSVKQVGVDLGALPGDPTGDAQADVVVVNDATQVRTIDVTPAGADVVVTGPAAEVRVTNGEPTLDRVLIHSVDGHPVNVNGSDAADTMTVFSTGTNAAVSVSGFNVFVEATGEGLLAVNGRGGDDTITALNGLSAIPLQLDGGDGNDVIRGSDAAEAILGGAGNDVIDGGFGADTAFLGPGDDTFIWNPGGGNDVVEGEDGTDTLLFNGANIGEHIDISANGNRVRFTRDIASIVMDLDGIERISFTARGGADTVVVNDLAGTSADQVNVDLGAFPGDPTGDAQADVVMVNDGTGAHTIDVAADGTAVVATGLAAEVRVTNGEPSLDRLVVNRVDGHRLNVNGSGAADTMFVFPADGTAAVSVNGFGVLVEVTGNGQLAVKGLGGDDTIVAQNGLSAFALVLDGGDGNDTIRGSDAAELLIGGPGNDVIDGGIGADTAFLGDGDDTFIWNPGGGNDTVEGEGGNDVLLFSGSNISEQINISANGSRLRFTRDIASIVMDVDGVERVDFTARGGADKVVVDDLSSTAVDEVNVDLAAIPGDTTGDAQSDTVTVNGSAAGDTIAISAEAGPAAVVSGLATTVRVVHPEPIEQLVVHGLGGLDTITVGPGLDGLILLTVNQD